MQSNESAFEGWILCLKVWFPNITQANLTWEAPMFDEGVKDDKNRKLHYNRFIYRLLQFRKMYFWFSFTTEDSKAINDFEATDIKRKEINFPENDKAAGSHNEDIIESLFVGKYNSLIKERLFLHHVNQQLPVGIFLNRKSSQTRLLPGGKAAIDIWGRDEDALSIFELKYENEMVGIISELLLYLGIMNDVFIEGKIHYPAEAGFCEYREFHLLHEKVKKIKRLNGYFLVDTLHPLITPRVVDLLNIGLREIGPIKVDTLYYNYYPQTKELSWK